MLEIGTKFQSQENFTWSWFTKYFYRKFYENISFGKICSFEALLYNN